MSYDIIVFVLLFVLYVLKLCHMTYFYETANKLQFSATKDGDMNHEWNMRMQQGWHGHGRFASSQLQTWV